MPSSAQRKSLERALTTYQGSITRGISYLQERGFDLDMALKWGLGVVESPEPGHEHFRNRLVVPYFNKTGIIGLKFRCMENHDCRTVDGGHQKYLVPTGQEDYLYNVISCDTAGDTIHVTEGETDCWTLTDILPEPVVGVPGAGKWRPHWPSHFRSFSRVLVWPDGDKSGRDMGNKWRKEIPAAEVVSMPDGFDVNSLWLKEGPEVFLKLAGVEDE
jgi:hypothetical protein